MKVGVLVSEFPRASRPYEVNHVTGLIERGHDVTVMATSRPPDQNLAPVEQEVANRVVYTPIPYNKVNRILLGIDVITDNVRRHPIEIARSIDPLEFGKDAVTLRPLLRLAPALGHSFDILHAHFATVGRQAAILKQVGIPGKLVVSIHGYGIRQAEEHPSRYADLLETADLFLANSEYTYRRILGMGVEESRVVHHPLGIDVESIPFKWEEDSNETDETVRIVTVARLVELKGIDYAIRAVAELLGQVEVDIEYHIIGDGDQRTALEDLADELGISESVTFHGHKNRTEVLQFLTGMDIFVLPSLEEAFGMVLLEAQAVGLPVVATEVGGIPEAVDSGESGVLVSPESVASLEGALLGIIQDVADWESMGRSGRSYVSDIFDVDRQNRQLIRHYKSLL